MLAWLCSGWCPGFYGFMLAGPQYCRRTSKPTYAQALRLLPSWISHPRHSPFQACLNLLLYHNKQRPATPGGCCCAFYHSFPSLLLGSVSYWPSSFVNWVPRTQRHYSPLGAGSWSLVYSTPIALSNIADQEVDRSRRTSASLMTPRTTPDSSSVPFSSVGREAFGDWRLSR